MRGVVKGEKENKSDSERTGGRVQEGDGENKKEFDEERKEMGGRKKGDTGKDKGAGGKVKGIGYREGENGAEREGEKEDIGRGQRGGEEIREMKDRIRALEWA